MVERASEFICAKCSDVFASRNKLFRHLTSCGKSSLTLTEMDYNIDDDDDECEARLANGLENCFVPTLLRVYGPDITYAYRVVTKPQGMPTMGSGGDNRKGINLLANDGLACAIKLGHGKMRDLLPEESQGLVSLSKMTVKRSVPVHRLDAATGGLILAAESHLAERYLKNLFALGYVQKRYRALLHGVPKGKSGVSLSTNGIDEVHMFSEPLDGKEAITAVRIVSIINSARHGCITTVDLYPLTGRNHQLRKHLRSMGSPIIGDRRYGLSHTWPVDNARYPWLFLWALELRFPDPNASSSNNSQGKPVPLWEYHSTGHMSACEETQLLCQVQEGMVHVRIPEPVYYKEYILSESK